MILLQNRECVVKIASDVCFVVTLVPRDNLYDKIRGEDGVIVKAESSRYLVNGHMVDISMRAKLRGLRDTNGQPLFKSDMQNGTSDLLDGFKMNFSNNVAFDKSKALMISASLCMQSGRH